MPTKYAVVNYASIHSEHPAHELVKRLRAAGYDARAQYAERGSPERVVFTTEGTRGFKTKTWDEALADLEPASAPTIPVKVLPHGEGLPLPAYETKGAAGMDLRAALTEDMLVDWEGERVFVLYPGARALIPTGLAMAIPVGFEVQVRPRSGLAIKHGISIVNTPGTVDCDYRGEIKIILINHSTEAFIIRHGDRIAQMVVAPVVQAKWQSVDELDETERGAGGYGSTGRQ